ncbi:MAG: S1 RNA-binding domain-containing protein [Candidatus Anstonellaceae archaeon]
MGKKFPKLNELVLAQIKKIFNYGAFCTLKEYDNYEAFLHISEVAPRWIKNIHEFLHEGQQLVVKVINVDEEKDQIDVSLKKVTEYEAKNKIKQYRQEKRANNIFKLFLKEASIDSQKEEKIKEVLITKYGSLFSALEEINSDQNFNLDILELNQEQQIKLRQIIQKNMKKAQIKISKVIRLVSYANDGIQKIKNVLLKIKEMAKKDEKNKDIEIEILYLGAPRYQLTIKNSEPKKITKLFEQLLKKIEKFSKENDVLFELEEGGTTT